MTSSEKKPGRDIDAELAEFGGSLQFNCYEFSRYVHAGRRRTVTASKCLCTWQSAKICDRTQLYEINFRPQATRLIF
jgi:hypothetical protein